MLTGIVGSLIAIAGGSLAAGNVIVARRPDAQDVLEKLAPFQGWIGLVMLLWGVWGIVGSALSVAALSVAPVLWVFGLLAALVCVGAGFPPAAAMLAGVVFQGNDEARAKADRLRETLAVYQVPLGFAAILVGLAGLLLMVLTMVRTAA
jgi:hypothetical protein